MNLANKYRPQKWEDMTEQTVVVDILKSFASQPVMEVRNFLLIGPAGTGKAQPLYSKILTPKGFIEMRDVQIGTRVFTAGGNIGTVSGVYPQGVRPIYEIELQDRTTIRVSDEHLNVVYRYNQDTKRREDFCLTTLELLDLFEKSRFKLRIDVPKVDWDCSDVPVDPYLLGALLGDGGLSDNFQFSNSEPDVVERVDAILRRDYNKMLKKCPGNNVDYDIVDVNYASHKYMFCYQGQSLTLDEFRDLLVKQCYPQFDSETLLRIAAGTAVNTFKHYPELKDAVTCSTCANYKSWTQSDRLRTQLNDLGVLVRSVDKHIPAEYLHTSRNVRMLLLQGLFDTDGYIDRSGTVTFTTCSAQLSQDFEFLVRSLGIRDTVVSHPAYYTLNGERRYTGSTAYNHNLKVPNDLCFCTSAKHMARRTLRQCPPLRNIVSIRYIGQEECQCIMIDHPDHTYISDGFIPTHNTTSARILANDINKGRGTPIEIDAASHNGADNARELVQQAQAYPVGCDYKVFVIDECHSFSSAAWQVMLKCLESNPAKSVFIFCTTNPEKIPATILSRVQTFQLSKISLAGICKRIKHVLDCEIAEGRQLTYTEDGVNFIAKLANGGMRDALTLLDKALAYSPEITTSNLLVALNIPNYDDYFTLLQAVAKRDNATIARIINDVYNSGANFIKWFEQFHAFVINIVKYIFLQDIDATIIPSTYYDKISKYGPAHSTICLKLANKLLLLNHELKSTQYLQEVALTYMCAQPEGVHK